MRLFPLLFLTLVFVGCKESQNIENESQAISKSKNSLEIIGDNFSKFEVTDFLSEKLLIGKANSLKGIANLNIKGDAAYRLDENGNIIGRYDITNSYSLYHYDDKGRLIRREIKEHTTDEVYHSIEYQYSKNDKVVKITKTKYEDTKQIDKEIFTKKINLNAKDVIKQYFAKTTENQYFINNDEREIITFESDLMFCCGETMMGKNRLTYYLNENEMIDSLVIKGIKSNRKMKFEYEYEMKN